MYWIRHIWILLDYWKIRNPFRNGFVVLYIFCSLVMSSDGGSKPKDRKGGFKQTLKVSIVEVSTLS